MTPVSQATPETQSPALQSSNDRLLIIGLCAILAAVAMMSLLSGRVWLSPSEILRGLMSSRPDLASLILTELRLPRTLLAIAAGATLGLAGAVLQGLTRNPLAEPGLLGAAAGASLGAVIAIYFGISQLAAIATPLAGLIGASAAMVLTFALGGGGSTLALVLAGTAVNGLLWALIQLALNLAPGIEAVYEIMTWLMGSLANASWDQLVLAGPFIITGAALLASTARALDALALGELQASSLGIDLKRVNIVALLGTAMAVGAATSVTGAIGFIGLAAPHLVRAVFGHQPSRVLMPSAIAGATLLVAADIATRLFAFGPEMKLGVLTALFGSPFFFYFVMRLRKVAP